MGAWPRMSAASLGLTLGRVSPADGDARRDVLRFLAECPGGLAGMSPRLAVTLCVKHAVAGDLDTQLLDRPGRNARPGRPPVQEPAQRRPVTLPPPRPTVPQARPVPAGPAGGPGTRV